MTFRLKSRVTRKCHARFGNGGGAGDRPADRNLGAFALNVQNPDWCDVTSV
jgi:hypothetical protein